MRTIGAERLDTEVEVIVGVDTHLDFHAAVVVDHLGRRLGEVTVPTTVKGYEKLLRWAQEFGPVSCAGVEGTSSYGAGLARHLRARGISVVEVERPKRRHLRRNGKSDPIDAEAAAGTVLAGEAVGEPKSAEGQNPGRQPAAGFARDGTGATAQPFTHTFDEGACLGGRTLPPLR